jgi:hypothetical protein
MNPLTYKKNPQTAGRVIDGLAFVVTPDDNKLHTLNATATLLWQLAAKDGLTATAAADELTRRYQVEREAALADADACLRDLAARHILISESLAAE